MIELHPHSTYCIHYKDGTSVTFCTLEKVHKAKHLIKVVTSGTNEEVDLVGLLAHKKWIDIEEINDYITPYKENGRTQ